jgi:hypothetical protein
MNSQRHERCVDDHAAEHDPEPAADAEHRADEPDRDADLLRWELVADDRERQREHRSAVPASARNAISDQMFHATAQPTQPARKSERLITSSRSFPYWSPSFPRTGVATDATSRKTVSTHVAQVVVVSSSRWITGSAGTTIVCWNANAVPASASAASVTL